MSKITVPFSTAARRFNRRNEGYTSISKLRARARNSLQAEFALWSASNYIIDTGDISDVERWCREDNVLNHNERLTA